MTGRCRPYMYDEALCLYLTDTYVTVALALSLQATKVFFSDIGYQGGGK